MEKSLIGLFEILRTLIKGGTTIVIALATVGFLWGIVKILFNSDNELVKKEGRSFMLYGVITLFVMTSLWSLVNLLSDTIIPESAASGQNKNNNQKGNNNYLGDVNDQSSTGSGTRRPAAPPPPPDLDKMFKNQNEERAT